MKGFSKAIASLGIPVIAMTAMIVAPDNINWWGIGALGLFEVMAIDIIFKNGK